MRSKIVNIGFIGTGQIAEIHAEAISNLNGFNITKVYDINKIASEKFARKFSANATTVEDLLSDTDIDSIHILTPPDTHGSLLLKSIQSGKSLFIEKPICVEDNEIFKIETVEPREGQVIAVNQNMVFLPAFITLRKHIESGKYGQIRHFDLAFRPALRQLAARQFSHWMFRSQRNLLLEQAVHPISQLVYMLKRPDIVQATPIDFLRINSENTIAPSFVATMRFGSVGVSFNFGVGALYPTWRLTAYCDDGIIEADMMANYCVANGRTPYIDPIDQTLSTCYNSIKRSNVVLLNLFNYSRSIAGLTKRNDSFYLSMEASISHYYGAIKNENKLLTNRKFGLDVIKICLEIEDKLREHENSAYTPIKKNFQEGKFLQNSELKETTFESSSINQPPNSDSNKVVCILGATGFIGRYAVSTFIAQGYKVRAVARNLNNLPDIFRDPKVEVVRGNVTCAADMKRAIDGAKWVVNLAHGGGGNNFDEIKAALVDSAALVAQESIKAGVKRVIHVGSIAGLYLGNPAEIITGATPCDQQPELRGDYARAKALADAEFERVCRQGNIEYVILRPGIVVGAESHPLHSGLGFFNNEGNVVGWSKGNHPLPFVLVEDVADAIFRCVVSSQTAGKIYNIAANVDITAKEYIQELNTRTNRRVRFHPKSPRRLWLEDYLKCAIKRIGGRKIPFPSIRDFRSRAMYARVDCTDLRSTTEWSPVEDKDVFFKKVFCQ